MHTVAGVTEHELDYCIHFIPSHMNHSSNNKGGEGGRKNSHTAVRRQRKSVVFVCSVVASRDRDTTSKFRISFPLVNEQCMHIVTLLGTIGTRQVSRPSHPVRL